MRKIAHRSGPTAYPEQTVSSALRALQNGADMIELDTRFSADGVIIVSHDDNLERVFGENRHTYDLTAAQFKALTHKDAPDFHGHTLEDYVSAGAFPMLIHVKEGGENLPALLGFLKEKNCLDKVILGVSRTPDIAYIKNYDENIRVLAFLKNPDYIDESAEAGADYIRLWEKWYTDALFEKIKALGKECWIMTGEYDDYKVGYTSEEKIKFFADVPVDGILVNDISVLKDL